MVEILSPAAFVKLIANPFAMLFVVASGHFGRRVALESDGEEIFAIQALEWCAKGTWHSSE